MFCSHCGKKLSRNVNFCMHCGERIARIQPESSPSTGYLEPRSPKKSKTRKILVGALGSVIGALLMAVILLLMGFLPSGETVKIEGPGFSTPEEAATAYLIGLREQDMNAMISSFAMESYAAHYDFTALVERFQIYLSNVEMPLPGTNKSTRRYNVESRRSKLIGSIIRQYMAYHAPEPVNSSPTVTLEDAAAITAFVKSFEDSAKNYLFADMKITGTMQPEDMTDQYLLEANQKIIARQAKVFGAGIEDVKNVVITFDASGRKWIFTPQAVRYNGKWYLESLIGNLSILLGQSTYTGGIVPID